MPLFAEPRRSVVRLLHAVPCDNASLGKAYRLRYFGCRGFRALYGNQWRARAISLSVREPPIRAPRSYMGSLEPRSLGMLGWHRCHDSNVVGWECPALVRGGSGLRRCLVGICSVDAALRSSCSGGIVN